MSTIPNTLHLCHWIPVDYRSTHWRFATTVNCKCNPNSNERKSKQKSTQTLVAVSFRTSFWTALQSTVPPGTHGWWTFLKVFLLGLTVSPCAMCTFRKALHSNLQLLLWLRIWLLTSQTYITRQLWHTVKSIGTCSRQQSQTACNVHFESRLIQTSVRQFTTRTGSRSETATVHTNAVPREPPSHIRPGRLWFDSWSYVWRRHFQDIRVIQWQWICANTQPFNTANSRKDMGDMQSTFRSSVVGNSYFSIKSVKYVRD